MTLERITQLEEHVSQNDLAVPETMGAPREVHSKVNTLEARLQEVGSIIDSSPREVHTNTLREQVTG